MPSPFPGMNPYFEDRQFWPGFHHHLADEMTAYLNGVLPEGYYADIEVHTVLEVVGQAEPISIYPDVGVLESEETGGSHPAALAITPPALQVEAMLPTRLKLRTVLVRLLETREVVTAIELLSPANKRGEGYDRYLEKRENILQSKVHLVEIDFLRAGKRPAWELAQVENGEMDYVVIVNRNSDDEARISSVWPLALNESLPTIPIPLLYPDPDVALDLNALIHTLYERQHYERIIDYARPVPPPALRPQMADWVEAQLNKRRT